MAGFLADKGLRILRNGYNVIPIKPGQKYPTIERWQKLETTPALIQRWLRNGHAQAGVGITTGAVSFVDLDTPDERVAMQLEDWILLNIGLAPVRIGNAPKRGLMFRAETPFRKVTSKTYIDERGREVRVEILGIGQQFVSHHIHPETGKPYLWGRQDGPEFIPVAELPPITEEQARSIVEHFETIASSRNWPVKKPNTAAVTNLPAPSRYGTGLDEFGLGTDPLGLSDEELTAKVMAIPNEDWPYGDDSDTETIGWFKIVAAIHHETGGSDFGRSLAYEWSDQSAKHEDGRFEKTWNSFAKGDARPITARYVLRWAKFYERAALAERLADVLLRMDVAGDLDELKAAAGDAKKLDVDMMDRGRLIVSLQKNAKRFGVTLGIKDARDMVRYEPDVVETPDWLNGWVYLSHADRFFNLESKQMLTEKAFDNTFGRYTGDTLASDFALDKVKIETAYMAGYLPGEGDFFTLNGNRYANTYSERNVPRIPAKLEGRDRENVQRVLRHFAHLFTDERERQIFISWCAYIVQTKQRPNWAIVLQGVEGDGKNFFGNLMAAVLGGDNVRTVFAKTLEAPHNAWAEGQLFTFIEEVRMIGHNRYDIINSIKPLITNPTVEIHAKNINPYTAPNTTAYMLTTNFQNALPLNDNDRRYFILMSQWQDARKLQAFLDSNPTYFADLYRTLDESPGALLGWLTVYKLHPDFDARGRAPHSHGRRQMVELNKSSEGLTLEDIIEEGKYPDICEDLVIVSSLIASLADETGIMPQGKGIEIILREAGFTYIGRPKINGKKESVWSKNPDKFGRNAATVFSRIRYYLENPL
jgi:hypothetical protein